MDEIWRTVLASAPVKSSGEARGAMVGDGGCVLVDPRGVMVGDGGYTLVDPRGAIVGDK